MAVVTLEFTPDTPYDLVAIMAIFYGRIDCLARMYQKHHDDIGVTD